MIIFFGNEACVLLELICKICCQFNDFETSLIASSRRSQTITSELQRRHTNLTVTTKIKFLLKLHVRFLQTNLEKPGKNLLPKT